MPFRKTLVTFLMPFWLLTPGYVRAANEAETKKNHLEDIFIWKVSDELKLTAKEEREFTDISRSLNRQKAELNRKIQESILALNENSGESALKDYRGLVAKYNAIALTEHDTLKKLLGTKKYVSYLKIKNELNTRLKSILIGEKSGDKTTDKKEIAKLPPPKIIIQKGE